MISPYTGEVVPIAPVAPPRASRGAQTVAPTMAPEVARAGGSSRAGVAGGSRRRGEHRQGQGRCSQSVDDIEIDETIEDDDDDDSTFIADEEEGDEDVTDIIGDVGGDEET